MTGTQLSELFARYGDDVYRFAYSFTRHAADAEDVCQTAFLRLLERPPAEGKEKPWLARVAVNECKNWRKTAWFRRRVPLDESLQLAAEDPEPEDGGLLAQVQALPAMYREVIFLRYYEGYEVKEIAALLGRSPALVSTHLKRGKEKLRNMLGGTEYARGF